MSDRQEKQRSPYQREMDEVRLPEARADETLRLMLEKNREIREKETNRKPSLRLLRLLPAFAAAAACLVLAVVLLNGGSSVTFGSVRMSGLPSGYRGEATETAPFAEVFGAGPEAFFPGWTVDSEFVSAARREAKLTLSRDGQKLSAAVSLAEPPLYTALADAGVESADGVLYNRDPEDGTLYAVCVLRDCYVTFSAAGRSETDFVTAVQGVISP